MDRLIYPLDYSLTCFYGLWLFVSILGLEENYLKTEEIKSRFCFYVRFSDLFHGLSLNNQDLSGCTIQGRLTSWQLHNVNFSYSLFPHMRLINCDIINSNFECCTFFFFKSEASLFSKCSFHQATLEFMQAGVVKFMQVNFKEAVIKNIYCKHGSTVFYDCDFSHSKIDPDALAVLENIYPGVKKGRRNG
jgi:uncharacterized protein YjbI with pentapeptide repeats